MNTLERLCLAACMLLAVTAICLSAWAVLHDRAVVRAEMVEIMDHTGRRRVLLGVSPEGTAGMGLYDQQGRLRLSVGVLPDGRGVMAEMDANAGG